MKLPSLSSALVHFVLLAMASTAWSATVTETTPELVIKPLPAWVDDMNEVARSPTTSPVQRLISDDEFRLGTNQRDHYHHQVELVQSADGLASAGQIQISYDPTFQKLTMHRLEVVRAGKRINQLNRQSVQFLHRETELERSQVDGLITASVILSDVRVGDRIDFAFSVEGSNPAFEGRFADLRTEGNEKAPVTQFRYRLLYPSARQILYKVPARVHAATAEKGDLKELVFTDNEVPQAVSEPGSSTRDWYPQILQISEWHDWDEVSAWGGRLFDLKGAETPAVTAQVQKLAANKDPVLATVDFVQKDVRYFAREIGFNTHRPTAPEQTLLQRSGDCKDKVMLLLALLHGKGVDAQPVLINLTDPSLDRVLPSPLGFDHVVARITLNGTPVYIDATRDAQTGPLQAREATGLGKGLLLAGDGETVIRLPDQTDKPSVEATEEIDIPRFKDGATVRTRTVLRGIGAEYVRNMASRQPREFNAVYLDPMLRVYPGATVLQEPTLEEMPNDDAIAISSVLRITEPFDSTGFQTLMVNLTYWNLAGKLRIPSAAKRQTSFDLGPPALMRQTIHLNLGEAGTVATQQTNGDAGDNHLHIHTQYSGSPKDIKMTADLRVSSRYVEAADWDSFSTELGNLRKATSIQVNLGLYAPDSVARIKTEIERQMKQDVAKQRSQTEINNQMVTLLLTRALAADRLPPHLRSKFDLGLGAVLDAQDQCLRGRDAIVEANSLAPELPEGYGMLAFNDACLNRDDEALIHINHAIQLRPADYKYYLGRGQVQFAGGHYAEAASDFREAASHIDASQVPIAITWLCLASLRLNSDCESAIKPYQADVSAEHWPGPVVDYLVGKREAESLLQAAKADTNAPYESAEAYFYIAEKQLLAGSAPDALSSFKRVGEHIGYTSFERIVSDREMTRMAAAPTTESLK